MAKINGLSALFNIAQIAGVFNEATETIDNKALETLKYMGELFVNEARVKGNYNDRTGNLRSSIGYIIVNDGKVIEQNFETTEDGSDRKTGKDKAEDYAREVALQYPRGLALIGVAGMEYALYVENRHHLDVISGSVPDDDYFKSIMDEIKF